LSCASSTSQSHVIRPSGIRLPGRSTATSAPMIGWTPASLQAPENSIAPNMLLRSASATAGSFIFRHAAAIASGVIAPSSIE
jgi:hypothetical protein